MSKKQQQGMLQLAFIFQLLRTVAIDFERAAATNRGISFKEFLGQFIDSPMFANVTKQFIRQFGANSADNGIPGAEFKDGDDANPSPSIFTAAVARLEQQCLATVDDAHLPSHGTQSQRFNQFA